MTTRKELVERIMRCAVCSESLVMSEDGKSALCCGPRRHCFDFSKDGYLSLPMSSGGDSKSAVDARKSFLEKGYYEPCARAIVDAMSKYVSSDATVIDAGCGEGYYTSMLAKHVSGAIGFDLSKFACAVGAKRAKREGEENLLYSTASVFELPVKDNSTDAVVNIFAPCAEEEYARVLKGGGYLFVVGAGKEHLMGLKRAIYDDVYENGERADLPKNLEHIDKIVSRHEIAVDGQDDIAALFSMTPYYWRTSESDREKLKALSSLETTIEFEINIYRK
ncbi:MAG: methyltransferase domain-containing protein [Ruminococcaceae bacterium]|nr:methyltransferase domain-containing protein [Oscillospiraceae bacterium]